MAILDVVAPACRAISALDNPNPSPRSSATVARTLGESIKKWRLEQGLFQKDLAKMIGVAEMTIVNWEKGRTRPIMDKLQIIRGIIKIEQKREKQRD